MRTNATLIILLFSLVCAKSFAQTLWKQVLLPESSQQYRFIDFADSLNGWVFSDSGAYARTADGGKNWEGGFLALPSTVTQIKSFLNNTCWVVSGPYHTNHDVFYTTNGKDWQQLTIPDTIVRWGSSGIVGFSTPACIWFPSPSGVFVSSDMGSTWTLKISGWWDNNIEFADSLDGYVTSEIEDFTGGMTDISFGTTDGGVHWDTLFYPHPRGVFKFYNSSDGFCLLTSIGMEGYPTYYYLSATFDSWKTSRDILLSNYWYQILGCLVYPNGKQFLLTDQNRIRAYSLDSTKYIISADTVGAPILAFESISENYNWILASGNQLFQSIDIPTRVYDLRRTTPSDIQLDANFPNPFNGSTVISFQLPKAAVVRLSIFDCLGREISILLNGLESAGRHSVSFNALNLPSGVYFYRFVVGSYSTAKKMLLLK